MFDLYKIAASKFQEMKQNRVSRHDQMKQNRVSRHDQMKQERQAKYEQRKQEARAKLKPLKEPVTPTTEAEETKPARLGEKPVAKTAPAAGTGTGPTGGTGPGTGPETGGGTGPETGGEQRETAKKLPITTEPTFRHRLTQIKNEIWNFARRYPGRVALGAGGLAAAGGLGAYLYHKNKKKKKK